jgi:DNA-directed RNA polymerase specialized sigma24 family protein
MPEAQDKFQTLVDRHKKILYKVCNSYCRNPDDRDDLAQQIVAQLWQSFRSFDGRVTLDELNKALILLYLDGHTNREIGEVLGISETNAATKISRLKTTMRQEFTGIGRA